MLRIPYFLSSSIFQFSTLLNVIIQQYQFFPTNSWVPPILPLILPNAPASVGEAGALGGHRRLSSVSPSVRPSVCLSDVAYIGSNSKTKRPRKTTLCTGVPQVTRDSQTDFKVKRSKVKVTGWWHIVAAT